VQNPPPSAAPSAARAATSQEKGTKRKRSQISFETLAKHGYSAGEGSLASSYADRQAAKAAEERRKLREEEECRLREEEKAKSLVEVQIVPQAERRASTLKAQLERHMNYQADRGNVLDADSVYGNCLQEEKERLGKR